MSDPLLARLRRVFGVVVLRLPQFGLDINSVEVREALLVIAMVGEFGRAGRTLLDAGLTPEEVDDLAHGGRVGGLGWMAAVRMAARLSIATARLRNFDVLDDPEAGLDGLPYGLHDDRGEGGFEEFEPLDAVEPSGDVDPPVVEEPVQPVDLPGPADGPLDAQANLNE